MILGGVKPETFEADGKPRLDTPLSCVVVGGGLAGIAAATVLAERGATVTVVEREAFLGGRAGAWTDALEDGAPFEMERGFHAFFRQYYNVRALLRRIDPELDLLEELEDYPILGAGGAVESFAGLTRTPPLNVVDLTRRTDTLGLRDLVRVNARAALAMLAFDPHTTYRRYDDRTARDYLDSLRFPQRARRMLFDVFSHSFFNPESDMSAAELLMMFHFYFMGNPEGLVFDVVRRPFSTAIWAPLSRYLEHRGVSFRLERSVETVERTQTGFRVVTELGEALASDAVVLAVSVPALQSIVARSPGLGDRAWHGKIHGLAVTQPFAVWRLWLDRPTRKGRAPFAGTTAMGPLDNISLYHLFQDESRQWAEPRGGRSRASRARPPSFVGETPEPRGGSVVELHAYALETGATEDSLKPELLAGLHELYPETRGAGIVCERFFIRRDCPAFAPGSHRSRPGVRTGVPGLALAGDFVRLDVPSALMERAVLSGFWAASAVLEPRGVRPEPYTCVPSRGLLSRIGAWT